MGHGELREITEDDFLREVTGSPLVVVHFFHPEFETCKVMNKHLRELAGRALQTKYLLLNGARRARARHAAPALAPQRRLTARPPRALLRPPCPRRRAATKAAFFVAKLKVKTLPTLVYFNDGVATGRQVGYDGLRITTTAAGVSSISSGSAAASAAAAAAAPTAAASTDFSTASLARAMRAAGVFGAAPIVGGLDEEEDEDDGGSGGGGYAAGGGAGGHTAHRARPVGGALQGAADAAAELAAARKRMLEEMAAADEEI